MECKGVLESCTAFKVEEEAGKANWGLGLGLIWKGDNGVKRFCIEEVATSFEEEPNNTYFEVALCNTLCFSGNFNFGSSRGGPYLSLGSLITAFLVKILW